MLPATNPNYRPGYPAGSPVLPALPAKPTQQDKVDRASKDKKRWPDADVLAAGTDYSFFAKALMVSIGVEAGTSEYQAAFPDAGGVDLAKADGEVYEVRRFGESVSCTCEDYKYRRGPSGTKCKHGVALRLLALL